MVCQLGSGCQDVVFRCVREREQGRDFATGYCETMIRQLQNVAESSSETDIPRMLVDFELSARPPLTRASQVRTTPSFPAVQTSPAPAVAALATTDETSPSVSAHDQLSTS